MQNNLINPPPFPSCTPTTEACTLLLWLPMGQPASQPGSKRNMDPTNVEIFIYAQADMEQEEHEVKQEEVDPAG